MSVRESLIIELTTARFFTLTRELLLNQIRNRELTSDTVLSEILGVFREIKPKSILELCVNYDDILKSVSDVLRDVGFSDTTIKTALLADHDELLTEFNFTKVNSELLIYLGIRSTADLDLLVTSKVPIEKIKLIQIYFNSSTSHETTPRVIEKLSKPSLDLEIEPTDPENHWGSSTGLRMPKFSSPKIVVSGWDSAGRLKGMARTASSSRSTKVPSRMSTQPGKDSDPKNQTMWFRKRVVLWLVGLMVLAGVVITLSMLLIKKPVGSSQSPSDIGSNPPNTSPKPFMRTYISSNYITNLTNPTSLFITPTSLLIFQSGLNRISKYTPSSGLQTYAGTGVEGHQDGPQFPSQFDNNPQPTFSKLSTGCIDSTGLLYLSDSYAIRRVDKSPTVVTIAGNITQPGDLDGLGTDAKFGWIRGMAYYNDKVYIADSDNGVIKVIDVESRTSVRSLVKVGKDVDAIGVYMGVVYFTKLGDNTIYKENSGNVSVFVGSADKGFKDGKGGDARFDSPVAISFDSSGYMYVVDQGNNRIRKVDLDGNAVTLSLEGLNKPMGVAIDGNDNVYVSDSGNGIVKKLVPVDA